MEPSRHALKQQTILEVLPYLNDEELDKLPSPLDGRSNKRIRILKTKNLLIRIAENDHQRRMFCTRLNQMELVREFIEQKDFKHVKIPKASRLGNYMVEKLVPIIADGTLASIAYYMKNFQFFDKPVIEFLKLLYELPLDDIIGNSGWMESNWSYGVPRFDNVLIYEKIKNKETIYKIALIDLEALSMKEVTDDSRYLSTKNVILFFPYHYDIVMETALKIVKFTEAQAQELISCRESAIESINRAYIAHGNYIIQTRSLKTDPLIQFSNSPEAKAALIKEVLKEIATWQDHPPKSFKVTALNIDLERNCPSQDRFMRVNTAIVYLKTLGDNPKKYLDYIKTTFLESYLENICYFLKENIQGTQYQIPFKDFSICSERVFFNQLKDANTKFPAWDSKSGSTFTAVELTTKFDQTLIKPVHPLICDDIIKSQLDTGVNMFNIRKLIYTYLKENGLVADLFCDNKFLTVLY